MESSGTLVRPVTTRGSILIPPLHIPSPEEIISVTIRKQLGLSTLRGEVHIEGLLTPGADNRFQNEIMDLLHTSNMMIPSNDYDDNISMNNNNNNDGTIEPSSTSSSSSSANDNQQSSTGSTEDSNNNNTGNNNNSTTTTTTTQVPVVSSILAPPPVIIRHTLPPANVRMPASARTVTKVILSDGHTITGPEAEKIAHQYETSSPSKSNIVQTNTVPTVSSTASVSDSQDTKNHQGPTAMLSDTNSAAPPPHAGRRSSISITVADGASVAIDAKKIALQRKSRKGSVTAADIVYSVDAPAWYTDTTTTGKMIRKMNLHPFLGIDVNVTKLESEWVTDKKGIVRRRSSVQRELMQELAAASSSSSSSAASTGNDVPTGMHTRSSSASDATKRDRSKDRSKSYNDHINPHVSVLASSMQDGENIAELQAKLEAESIVLVQELQKARSRSSSSSMATGSSVSSMTDTMVRVNSTVASALSVHTVPKDKFWWDNMLRQPSSVNNSNYSNNNPTLDAKENESFHEFSNPNEMFNSGPCDSSSMFGSIDDSVRYVTSIPEDQQSSDENSGNEDNTENTNNNLNTNLISRTNYSPVPGSAFSRPTSRGAASRPISRGIIPLNNGNSPNSRPGSQSVGIRSPSNRDIIVYGFTTNTGNDRSPNRGNSNSNSRPSTHGIGSRSGTRHSPHMGSAVLSQQDISNKLTELSLSTDSMEGVHPSQQSFLLSEQQSVRKSLSKSSSSSLPMFPAQAPDEVLQSHHRSPFYPNHSKDDDDDIDNNPLMINTTSNASSFTIPEKYLAHPSLSGTSSSVSPSNRNIRSSSRPRSYITSSWPDTISFQRVDTSDTKHRPTTKQGTSNVYDRLYTAGNTTKGGHNNESMEQEKGWKNNSNSNGGSDHTNEIHGKLRSTSRSTNRSQSRSGRKGNTHIAITHSDPIPQTSAIRTTSPSSPKPDHSPYANKEVLVDTIPKTVKDNKSRSPPLHKKPFTTSGGTTILNETGKRSSSSSTVLHASSSKERRITSSSTTGPNPKTDGRPTFPPPASTSLRTNNSTVGTESMANNSVISLSNQHAEKNQTVSSAVRFSPVPLGSSSSTPLLPSATSSVMDINTTLMDSSMSVPPNQGSSNIPPNSNIAVSPFAVGNLSMPVSVHASALSSPVNSTVLSFDPSSNNFRALGGAATITGNMGNSLAWNQGRNSVMSYGQGYNSNFLLSTLPTPTGLSALQFNSEGLLTTNSTISSSNNNNGNGTQPPPLTAVGLSNLSAAFQARLAEFSRSLMNTPASLASPSMMHALNSTSGNPPVINFNSFTNYPPSHPSYSQSSSNNNGIRTGSNGTDQPVSSVPLPVSGRGSTMNVSTPVSFSLATYTPNKGSIHGSLSDHSTVSSVQNTNGNVPSKRNNPSENSSLNASVNESAIESTPSGGNMTDNVEIATPGIVSAPTNNGGNTNSATPSSIALPQLSVNTNIQPNGNVREGSRESPSTFSFVSPSSSSSSVLLPPNPKNMDTITAMASATVLDSFKNIADKYLGSRSHSSLGNNPGNTFNNSTHSSSSLPSASSSSASSVVSGGIPVPQLVINRLQSPSLDDGQRSTTSSHHSRTVSVNNQGYFVPNEIQATKSPGTSASNNMNNVRLHSPSGNNNANTTNMNETVSPSTVRAYSRSGIRSRSRSNTANTPLTPPRSVSNSSSHSLTPSRTGIMSRQQASRLGSRTGIGVLAAGSVIEYTQSLIDAVPPLPSLDDYSKSNDKQTANVSDNTKVPTIQPIASLDSKGNTYSTLLPESTAYNQIGSPTSIYSNLGYMNNKSTIPNNDSYSPYSINMQAYQTEYSSHNVPFTMGSSLPSSHVFSTDTNNNRTNGYTRGEFGNSPFAAQQLSSAMYPDTPSSNPIDTNTPSKPRWIGPRGKVVNNKLSKTGGVTTTNTGDGVTNHTSKNSNTKPSGSSIKSTHSPFLTYRQMHGNRTTLESLLTRSIDDVTEFYTRAEELVAEVEKSKIIQDRSVSEAQKKSRQNSLVASSSRPAQIITPNRSNNPSPNPNKSRASSPSLGTLVSIQETEVGFTDTQRVSETTANPSELSIFGALSTLENNTTHENTMVNSLSNPVIPLPKVTSFVTPVKHYPHNTNDILNNNTYNNNNYSSFGNGGGATNVWDPFGNAFSTPTPRTATQDILPSVTIGRRVISSNNPLINGGATDFDLQQASYLAEQLLYADIPEEKEEPVVIVKKKSVVPKVTSSKNVGSSKGSSTTSKEKSVTHSQAIERKTPSMVTAKGTPQRTTITTVSKKANKDTTLKSSPPHQHNYSTKKGSIVSGVVVENIALIPTGTVAPVSNNLMILHSSIPRSAVQQEADELAKKANQLLNWTENYSSSSSMEVSSGRMNNNENDYPPPTTVEKVKNDNNNDSTVLALNSTSTDEIERRENTLVPSFDHSNSIPHEKDDKEEINMQSNNVKMLNTDNNELPLPIRSVVDTHLTVETTTTITTIDKDNNVSVPSSAEQTNVPSSLFISPVLFHTSSSPSLLRPHSQGFPVTSSRLLSQSAILNNASPSTSNSPSRSIKNGTPTTIAAANPSTSEEFLINPFSDALPSSRPSTVPHGYSPRSSSNNNRRGGDTSPVRSTHHKASQNVAPYRAPVTNS